MVNLSYKVNFVQADCEDLCKMKQFTKNIDVVIHIAGFAHSEINSIHVKKKCDELNYEFTRKLAIYASKMKVKKFIFLNTAHVGVITLEF